MFCLLQEYQSFQRQRGGWPCWPSYPCLPFCSPRPIPLHCPIAYPPLPPAQQLAFCISPLWWWTSTLSALWMHFSIFCACSYLTFINYVERLLKNRNKTETKEENKGENRDIFCVLYAFWVKWKHYFTFDFNITLPKTELRYQNKQN